MENVKVCIKSKEGNFLVGKMEFENINNLRSYLKKNDFTKFYNYFLEGQKTPIVLSY